MLTPEFLEDVTKVMEFGARKYERDNWKKGMPFNNVIDSLERHIHAFRKGQSLDAESGVHHMAHVAANAMFLLAYDRNPEVKGRFDDRGVEVDTMEDLPSPPALTRSETIS